MSKFRAYNAYMAKISNLALIKYYNVKDFALIADF